MSGNMLKEDRVAFIDQRLQELYPNPPVPLDHTDPYTLLVAVLLSAQCTDERVNQVTPALFELADNPFDMARESAETIRAIIKPCGLSPQKSKAIRRLSEILIEDHSGEVPQDFESLEKLPGVGHKNRKRCDGAVLRGPELSCRHAHTPFGTALGSNPWAQCQRNRARLETRV